MVSRTALGSSGLSISRLGLGCMGMSAVYGPTDADEALVVMARAVDLGVTFFDTADMYGGGANEELLARFLRQRRDEVVLATKCGIVRGETPMQQSRNTSPAYILSACDASLKRLGVETIDLYYLHRIDDVTPIEDSMSALADLVRAGKIRAVGLSEVTAETLKRAHAACPVSAVQSEYSLATRGGAIEDVIAACGEIGAAFVAYSPLCRGLLTGAYRSRADFMGVDFRAMLPRFQDDALAENLKAVDALARLAAALGHTPAQLALAWVLARAPHVATIPGAKRIAKLEENAGASSITLTPAIMEQLDRTFPPDGLQGDRYPAFLDSRPR